MTTITFPPTTTAAAAPDTGREQGGSAIPSASTPVPLQTDDQLRERVTALIGPAYRRQLWPVFLDRSGDQIPLLVPVGDLTRRPPAHEVERVVAVLAKLAAPHDLGAIAFALERPGGARSDDDDRALARRLTAACRRRAIALRAILLVHDDGVRVVPTVEYEPVSPPAARASTTSRARSR